MIIVTFLPFPPKSLISPLDVFVGIFGGLHYFSQFFTEVYFTTPLILGLAMWLVWACCIRVSNGVFVLRLGLKRHCVFLLTLLCLCPGQLLFWEGWEMGGEELDPTASLGPRSAGSSLCQPIPHLLCRYEQMITVLSHWVFGWLLLTTVNWLLKFPEWPELFVCDSGSIYRQMPE